jgi:microcin C transport system permease protein
MRSYFLRRLLLIIPTFLGVTLLVFAITRFVPGGPIERMITAMQMKSAEGGGGVKSVGGGASLSEDQMMELKKYYGFDKPIWESYLIWLKKVLMLDLGHSTRYGEPVWDTIKSRFPISIYYGVMTLILTYLICIPLGIYKAINHGSKTDNLSSAIIFIGYAVPGYVLGIGLILFFAANLEWFPLGGFVSDGFDELSLWAKAKNLLWHSALPLLAYMASSFAVLTFMMKNSLLDTLTEDYMRTAMAKGNKFNTAVFRHALRNSLIPIATHFGNNISIILTGSFLIETIFNINGFGLLGYESVVERDYPVVLGILVISSLLYMLGNILSDICVAIVDPRVQFK